MLYGRIRLEFERNLDPSKPARALAWYGSPLGKRITGLELALVSNVRPDAVADVERNLPSPRRLLFVERLDAGGGASETTVDVTMAIVRSLTRAFQPALPAVARLRPGQLDDQFARARNRTPGEDQSRVPRSPRRPRRPPPSSWTAVPQIVGDLR